MSKATPNARMPSLVQMLANCAEEGECLLWTGHVGNGGTPQVWCSTRYHQVRRLVCEQHTGKPIPAGRYSSMKCRSPLCIRPEHIRLLTTQEIAELAASEGKFSTPQRRAAIAAGIRKKRGVKLGKEDLQRIASSSASAAELAGELRVDKSYIARIRRNATALRGIANNSVFNLRA